MDERQKRLARKMSNPVNLIFFMLFQLPMGLISGLRIRTFNEKETVVSVPFKYLNKNPFKSIYFAVQSMAAEMSTATPCLIAIEGKKPSVAFIIVDLKAVFLKKATGRVYFTCSDNQKAFEAVADCISSGKSSTVTLHTVGKMKDGTVVSEFDFTWSFKQRKS